MHRMSAFLAVAAVIAVAGCGSADDSTGDPFAKLEGRLAETAYLPAYQRCTIEEAERLFSPEELGELAELPRNEALKAISKVLVPAELKCKQRSGDRVVDPDASPRELERTRDRRAKTLAEGVVLSGEGAALGRCVERQVESLSDSRYIEFENASFAAQASQLAQMAEPCLGA
jgi:hypothetical protein